MTPDTPPRELCSSAPPPPPVECRPRRPKSTWRGRRPFGHRRAGFPTTQGFASGLETTRSGRSQKPRRRQHPGTLLYSTRFYSLASSLFWRAAWSRASASYRGVSHSICPAPSLTCSPRQAQRPVAMAPPSCFPLLHLINPGSNQGITEEAGEQPCRFLRSLPLHCAPASAAAPPSRGASPRADVKPRVSKETTELLRAANSASLALREADRQAQRAAGFKPSADMDPFYDESLTPDQRLHYYDRADRDPVSYEPVCCSVTLLLTQAGTGRLAQLEPLLASTLKFRVTSS